MRILITGASGLVGSRIGEILGREYPFLILPERADMDITSSEQTHRFVQDKKPEVIVHTAAFTDNSAAEKERGNTQGHCWRVNVEGTKNIIEASREVGAYVVLLSTGSVFAGTDQHPGPFTEKDPPGDESVLSWYGHTKAVAESFLKDGTIIRMSHPVKKPPIFDIPMQEKHRDGHMRLDYIQTILSLFDENKLYPLFTDQKFPLSYMDDVAIAIRTLIGTRENGIYHVVSYDRTTPYELALLAIERARHVVPRLTRTTFDEFIKTQSLPLRFSKYHAIVGKATQKRLGLPARTWREIVDLLFPPASSTMVVE